MKIIVEANEEQWLELEPIKHINWVRVESDENFDKNFDAAAYFNLVNRVINKYYDLPIVIISDDSKSLHNKNVFIINSWSGFLSRNIWEIKGEKNEKVEDVISKLGKKLSWTNGEFVSSRIISMIINEAYFAFEENVSTKEEINTAMKLGTGYPYGPFEWASKIGLKNVFNLLEKLAKSDTRYTPSETLRKEANF
ncbi:MAG: 3-hydroxyacyl-CoA dehydrogenase family protein [Ferruginibacter sp.]